MKRRSFLSLLGIAAVTPEVLAEPVKLQQNPVSGRFTKVPEDIQLWAHKTPEQILQDIQAAVQQLWDDSSYRDYVPDPDLRRPSFNRDPETSMGGTCDKTLYRRAAQAGQHARSASERMIGVRG